MNPRCASRHVTCFPGFADVTLIMAGPFKACEFFATCGGGGGLEYSPDLDVFANVILPENTIAKCEQFHFKSGTLVVSIRPKPKP